MTIILVMYLSGLVCSICLEIDRRYELSWIWHEKVEGCKNSAEFRIGAKILKLYRPVGLSRKKCLELFGAPEFADKSRFKVDGKVTELELLHFSKNEKYAVELFFDDGICINCAVLYSVCTDKIHGSKGLNRRPSLEKLFTPDTSSQPGYKPSKKYKLLIPQYK